MATGTSPAPRASRNRLGCITCKIRKVKCGEEKPACRRCTSTGRTCDGYASVTRSTTPTQQSLARRSPSLSDQTQPSKLPFLAHEVRALEFFQLKTVPAVGGYFNSPFWDRLVLQVATTEPAVRSAVLAVSALHRLTDDDSHAAGQLTSFSLYSTTPQGSREALAEYTMALKHLRDRISAGPEAIPVVLIACVLFTCFESLCGNIDPALRHIRSGLDIIHSVKYLRSSSPDATYEPPPAHLQDIVDEEIIPVFGRLGIMSHTFGQPAWQLVPPDLDEQPLRRSKFTTIEQARVELNELNAYILQCKQACNPNRYPPYPEPTPQLLSRYSRFTQRLNTWYAGLSALLARLGTSLSPSETCAVHVMRIHYLVARGWLATALIPGECAYDAHFDIYSRIVALAQCYIDTEATMRSAKSSERSSTQNYTFDIGLIGPLYWVASRCRHPVLRRQAIALLSHCPRREGLWVASEVEPIARYIVAVEEKGMWDGTSDQDPARSIPAPGQILHDAVQAALDALSVSARTLSTSSNPSEYVQYIGDEWPLPAEHMRLHEIVIEGPAVHDPMTHYSNMRRTYDWIVTHTRDNMPFVAEDKDAYSDCMDGSYHDFSLASAASRNDLARLSPGSCRGCGDDNGGLVEGVPMMVTLISKPWGLEGNWKIGQHCVKRWSRRS